MPNTWTDCTLKVLTDGELRIVLEELLDILGIQLQERWDFSMDGDLRKMFRLKPAESSLARKAILERNREF